MTRTEFIGQFRNELLGMVLDAALANRRGAELALSMRASAGKLDALLGAMYDAMNREPPLATKPPAPKPVMTSAPRTAPPATSPAAQNNGSK